MSRNGNFCELLRLFLIVESITSCGSCLLELCSGFRMSHGLVKGVGIEVWVLCLSCVMFGGLSLSSVSGLAVV